MKGLVFEFMKQRKKMFWKYTIIAMIVSSIGVLFVDNSIIGYILIFFEMSILLCKLLRGNIAEYVAYYVIFICNCFEFSSISQVEQFYNLKDIRFLGINLGVWLLIPLILNFVLRPIKIGILRKEQKTFYKLTGGLLVLNIMAAIVGLLLIAFNDNKIASIPGIMSEYIGAMYSGMFIPIAMICAFCSLITYEKNRLFVIPISLQAAMLGCVSQIFVSFFAGVKGSYGGVDTLMKSVISIFIPFALLLFIDKENTIYPKGTAFLCMLGTAFMIRYNASGKLLLAVAVAVLITVYYIYRYNKKSSKCMITICVIGVVFLFPIMVGYLTKNSVLFSSKMAQVRNLFDFSSNENWLENLPSSPRLRVEEIRNVLFEYVRKPWLFFTGKGYMGSIVDNFGYFHSVQNEDFVTNTEWIAGIYFNLHEIASNLVMFGLGGIVYSIGLLKYTINAYKENIWIIFGTCWFVLFFGYSFTLSIFGVVALFYGLCDKDTYILG